MSCKSKYYCKKWCSGLDSKTMPLKALVLFWSKRGFGEKRNIDKAIAFILFKISYLLRGQRSFIPPLFSLLASLVGFHAHKQNENNKQQD